LGFADADGSTDASAEAEAEGATLAEAAADADAAGDPDGAPDDAGSCAAPKLHCGVVAAWQAATVAATPARPVTPAARRNPRRDSGEVVSDGPSVTVGGADSTGSTVVGSTGTGSPERGRLAARMVTGTPSFA